MESDDLTTIGSFPVRLLIILWANFLLGLWANFLLGAVVALFVSDWLLAGVVVDGWWPYIAGGAILATGVLTLRLVRLVAGLIGGRIGGAAVEWPGQIVVTALNLLLIIALVARIDQWFSSVHISGGWTFAVVVLTVWMADYIMSRAAASACRDESY
jgi:hypothetical protein